MFDIGLSAPELVIGMAVVVVAAALQGSIGFGLAVLSVPILTVVDPVYTPIPTLILSLFTAAATLVREHGDLDLEGLGWIIGGRIPGALFGAWILTVLTERLLGIVIGMIVLLAVGVLAAGLSVQMTRRSRLIAGTISGFSGTASGIGGPPLALLYRSQSGPVVRSTLGAIFTIGITINLVILTVVGVMTMTDV
ncbi:MAG TPA: sulfite exporter TauE/SafE family protein, partial [Acidimicrobiia bacterium]